VLAQHAARRSVRPEPVCRQHSTSASRWLDQVRPPHLPRDPQSFHKQVRRFLQASYLPAKGLISIDANHRPRGILDLGDGRMQTEYRRLPKCLSHIDRPKLATVVSSLLHGMAELQRTESGGVFTAAIALSQDIGVVQALLLTPANSNTGNVDGIASSHQSIPQLCHSSLLMALCNVSSSHALAGPSSYTQAHPQGRGTYYVLQACSVCGKK
jgi:hypothetical protein